jgi:uncharacterized protein YjbJ (UPF0337 family)
MNKNNDMTERGVADQVKGTVKEAAGKVRGDVGDALDNGGEHLKGRAQEASGNVQKNFGKAEQKVGDKLKKHTDETTTDESRKH